MKLLLLVALALALGAAVIWAADFEPGFVLLNTAAGVWKHR
jgi:HemY protein